MILLIGYLISCAAAAATKSRQSCPTLSHPIDGSTPGSPVPGILQANDKIRSLSSTTRKSLIAVD